jgi:hypothetical protein
MKFGMDLLPKRESFDLTCNVLLHRASVSRNERAYRRARQKSAISERCRTSQERLHRHLGELHHKRLRRHRPNALPVNDRTALVHATLKREPPTFVPRGWRALSRTRISQTAFLAFERNE